MDNGVGGQRWMMQNGLIPPDPSHQSIFLEEDRTRRSNRMNSQRNRSMAEERRGKWDRPSVVTLSNYFTLFGFMISLTGVGLIVTSFQLSCDGCSSYYLAAGISVSCIGVLLVISGRLIFMKYSKARHARRRIITVESRDSHPDRGDDFSGEAWLRGIPASPRHHHNHRARHGGGNTGHTCNTAPAVPISAPDYTSRPDLRTTFPSYPGSMNEEGPPSYSEAIKTYY